MKKLRISVEIIDDDGNKLIKAVSKREIPYLKEFEREGFDSAFGELETAVLEARKEASEEAVSQYITNLSKKKQNK
jgi:hypothetical protein